MKEALIKLLEKFNDKKYIEQHTVQVSSSPRGFDRFSLCYYVPNPTPENPTGVRFCCIRYVSFDDKAGFTSEDSYDIIAYPVTKDEAVEIEYIFHSILKKIEQIRLERVMEILNS